jgi:hypothetical protein
MTLLSSSLARCRAGRRDEFMALALEGMKLFERHGAHQARLLEALTAGEQHGMFVLTNEFPTAEAYGTFVDELYRDAEMEAFLARITGPDGPLLIESRSLAVEVPLEHERNATRGAIVEVYVARPLPGRFDSCRDLVAGAFSFLAQHGASNCRLTQLRNAGSRTGSLVATWEFENMRTRGMADDLWWTDSKAREVMEELVGTTAPMTPLSAGIYRDVHV